MFTAFRVGSRSDGFLATAARPPMRFSLLLAAARRPAAGHSRSLSLPSCVRAAWRCVAQTASHATRERAQGCRQRRASRLRSRPRDSRPTPARSFTDRRASLDWTRPRPCTGTHSGWRRTRAGRGLDDPPPHRDYQSPPQKWFASTHRHSTITTTGRGKYVFRHHVGGGGSFRCLWKTRGVFD